MPKIFRDDFFTQVGPSVPKIFRDDFFTQMGPSVPKIFRDDFSREWDHLCPRYVRLMFYQRRTICAQNVRFYIEAAIIVHGEIMLPVCCFPPFSQLFAFPYIYIYIFLFDLLFFACLSVFTQVGPSVPEILRGDFSPKWVHLSRGYLTVIFFFFRGDFLTEVRVPPFCNWGHLCPKF